MGLLSPPPLLGLWTIPMVPLITPLQAKMSTYGNRATRVGSGPTGVDSGPIKVGNGPAGDGSGATGVDNALVEIVPSSSQFEVEEVNGPSQC